MRGFAEYRRGGQIIAGIALMEDIDIARGAMKRSWSIVELFGLPDGAYVVKF